MKIDSQRPQPKPVEPVQAAAPAAKSETPAEKATSAAQPVDQSATSFRETERSAFQGNLQGAPSDEARLQMLQSRRASKRQRAEGGELPPEVRPLGPLTGSTGATGASGPAQASTVQDTGFARPSNDIISVGGVPIPRLEVPSTPPTRHQQQLLDTVFTAGRAPGGPSWLGYTDLRSTDQAKEATAAGPVKGSDGEPASLGKLAILRPGLGNFGPSAAFVFRAAQHADKVVMAYTNSHDKPELNKLRPATEIDGVPVPPELRGKVFVIGSPQNALVSTQQASDVFIEQMEAMHKDKELLGFDPLTSEATVIAHSQGGLSSTLSRQRLEEAGLDKAIGKLVAVGSPFKGAPLADNMIKVFSGGLASLSDFDDGHDSVDTLDPDVASKMFTEENEHLVDLSVQSTMGSPSLVVPSWGFPPFSVVGHGNINPLMRLAGISGQVSDSLSTPFGFFGLPREIARSGKKSDGLVPFESSNYGQRQLVLDKSYDHAGVFADYHVVDSILENL